MASVRRCDLPSTALLATYAQQGAYTDCYVTVVRGAVMQAAYVEAFYTTALFGIERLLLAWFVARPSTDDEARRLAAGSLDRFAAWRVEARADNQLLLCDLYGNTRSWLMTRVAAGDAGIETHVFFGSAVVPRRMPDGSRRLGLVFRGLLGFHALYSRALLRSARARLLRAHTWADKAA